VFGARPGPLDAPRVVAPDVSASKTSDVADFEALLGLFPALRAFAI
jgi:hypothetical protein